MGYDPADDVAHIVVNGQEYFNWKALRVQRDWHTNPSVFSFVCAEPGPNGQGYDALRLKPGDRADVYLGGVKAATCYITDRTATFDAESHDLIVSGKSMTCDLVDSSVPIKPGTFNGMTMEQVTRSLIAPHNVGLVLQNTPPIFAKPFKSLVPQYGETCFEMIQRMAVVRGVDMTDDENGNLVIGCGDPSAAPVAELVESRNILSARGTLSDQTAWSRYSVVGQNVGDSQTWPPRDYSATLTDAQQRSNRIRLMLSEHPGRRVKTSSSAANHELARCLWPQVQVMITVRGWKMGDGTLWKPLHNVMVYSPMLFPNETGYVSLSIQSVLFAQDDKNGTTTTLTLVRPEGAFGRRGDVGTAAIPGASSDGNPIDQPVPSQATPDAPDSL